MLYAETERLNLRAMEENDIPRCAELIGDWDVAKWLVRVPYPYSLDDAKWWYDHLHPGYLAGTPEFYIIADKKDNALIGGIGFHPPNVPEPEEGDVVLGYWLGKTYWSQGFMSEAVKTALPLAFARNDIKKVTTFTDPANQASQNVLRKAGFTYLGIGPRIELDCLRGSEEVTRWEMTREGFGKR
jgi:RimJ/RimL family protein N-acetyltransferase